jgi:hypothetical protein
VTTGAVVGLGISIGRKESVKLRKRPAGEIWVAAKGVSI